MNRIDIIKKLINKFGYRSYLEIGVRGGDCFKNISIDSKEAIDPDPKCEIDKRINVMTSDVFFENLSVDKKYDIVFIDGLHEHFQVLKDVQNSLNHLSENGVIVLHDCNPPSSWNQREPSEYDGTGAWNGTVWKAFVEYRSKRKDLNMFVVDCDWGVGIIQKTQKKDFLEYVCNVEDDITSYNWLNKNRKMALNLISPEDFQKWINGVSG